MKSRFDEKLAALCNSKKERSLIFNDAKYIEIVKETKVAKDKRKESLKLTTKEYRRLNRFDVLMISDKDILIQAGNGQSKII